MNKHLPRFILFVVILLLWSNAFARAKESLRAANPGDTITTSTGKAVVCSGVPITLIASPGPPGTTYQWYLNSTAIPVATATTYVTNSPGFCNMVSTTLGVPDLYPTHILNASLSPTISYTYVQATSCGNSPITYTSHLDQFGVTYSNTTVLF